jgi:hypothetical protein
MPVMVTPMSAPMQVLDRWCEQITGDFGLVNDVRLLWIAMSEMDSLAFVSVEGHLPLCSTPIPGAPSLDNNYEVVAWLDAFVRLMSLPFGLKDARAGLVFCQLVILVYIRNASLLQQSIMCGFVCR